MIRYIVQSMRIYQWTKNLVLFAGLIFTLKFLDPPYVRDTILGFFLFSLAVSGMYILNDILDIERDRLHVTKRNRPIATGAVSVRTAVTGGVLLLSAAIALSFAARHLAARGAFYANVHLGDGWIACCSQSAPARQTLRHDRVSMPPLSALSEFLTT